MISRTGWLYSWYIYWRAVFTSKAKRRGRGTTWREAFFLARHSRFVVYGQHRMV